MGAIESDSLNSSSPGWMVDYLQCAVLLSRALNLTVNNQHWISLLNIPSLVENNTSGPVEDYVAHGYGSFSEVSELTTYNIQLISTTTVKPLENFGYLLSDHFHRTFEKENTDIYEIDDLKYSLNESTELPIILSSSSPITSALAYTVTLGVAEQNMVTKFPHKTSFATVLNENLRQQSVNNVNDNIVSRIITNTISYTLDNTVTNTFSAPGSANTRAKFNLTVASSVASWCLAEVTHNSRPYLLEWWQQALWTAAFGTMLAVAVGGNALVMWIICGEYSGGNGLVM